MTKMHCCTTERL